MWHHPHIFYAVHKLAPTLPHLAGATSAFFGGARTAWDHFTSEHHLHGTIAILSPEERRRAFMNATNGHNEGALGAYRVGARKAPRMTIAQWNARTMYKCNGTQHFVKCKLTRKDRKWIRRAARKLDASQIEQKRRQAQAEADSRAASKKKAAVVAKQKKKEKAKARVDAVVPVFDPAVIKKLKNDDLDWQIKWHRAHGVGSMPLQKEVKEKQKVAALMAALERYKERKETSDEEGDTENFEKLFDSGDETDAELYCQ